MFPQKSTTKHAPDGEKPGVIRKSEHVGRGHRDSLGRLAPVGDFPSDINAGSGEGQGNPRPAGVKHPFNE